MKKEKIIKRMLTITIILILIDQFSKLLVSLLVKQDIVVIQNVFEIIISNNKVVSFRNNFRDCLILILALIIAIRFVANQKQSLTPKVVNYISMIFAGCSSNLIDRIFRKMEFNFIKLGDFPVFGLSDLFILLGWILFIIDLIKMQKIDKMSSGKKASKTHKK